MTNCGHSPLPFYFNNITNRKYFICLFTISITILKHRFRKSNNLLSLDWDDPLEEGKATHSRILAWRIPWTV